MQLLKKMYFCLEKAISQSEENLVDIFTLHPFPDFCIHVYMHMHRKRYLKAAVLVGRNSVLRKTFSPHISMYTSHIYRFTTHQHTCKLPAYPHLCNLPIYLQYEHFYFNLPAIFVFNFITYAHSTL